MAARSAQGWEERVMPPDSPSRSKRVFVKSQAHLLKNSDYNPLPTAVPPPIAAVAGTLGVRHVLSLIGLPQRGKPFIAKRLKSYLSFFHGAEVALFDVSSYAERSGAPAGSDENAQLLLDELKEFMEEKSSQAGMNMDVSSSRGNGSDGDTMSDERGSDEVAHANTPPRQHSDEGDEATRLVDETDRRRKHVDSGKVAILYSTDSFGSFTEQWSGTSKERRQWAADVVRKDKSLGAKLIFIEVIVTKEEVLIANVRSKYRAEHPNLDKNAELPPQVYRDFSRRVHAYQRKYVTLQDDGSEDCLSYIKLINYGDKVVTNRMHGYLRMRIAQFLTTIHPSCHTIYLSRHGQSEYNVLGKIGGNPPLSSAGAEYAQRLGAWVPENVCTLKRNGVTRLEKVRLWTSSLQRTILTAAHIPHPIIPISHFGSRVLANGAVLPRTPGPPTPVKMSSPSTSFRSDFRSTECISSLDMELSACEVAARDEASRLDGSVAVAIGSKDSPPAMHAAHSPPDARSPSALRRASSLSLSRDEVPRIRCSRFSFDDEDEDEVLWEQMSPRVYRNLDEIFAGEYEGYTYEEIKSNAPDEASLRAMDKIGYRYPRGESYFDILARLDPLVHELESYHEPLMVVSHQAVLRLLYAYLTGRPRETAPTIEIPLHTVMKITYDGWNAPYEERFVLGPAPVQKSDGQQHL